MTDKAEKRDYEAMPQAVSRILNSYKKHVFSEMYFLRDNGGRRYKVSNGRRIGKSGSAFSYSFEMESELYLSEDSPITLTSGERSSKGTVLACEDFQILVNLDQDLGEKLPSGHISVEPWKLLESLGGKISKMSDADKVALALMAVGPRLRTDLPIEDVPTGQGAAMAHALSNDPVTVIWGPPGTGKTHTMAEIAISFLKQGKTVLAVSHSNISVDGVASKVAELMRAKGMQRDLEKGSVLRFGYVRDEALTNDEDVVSYNFALKSDPALARRMRGLTAERDKLRREGLMSDRRRVQVEEEIKKLKKKVVEKEREAVAKARMVATTVSRIYANKLFEGLKYDVVMFDEVSMAYVPQVICAAMFAKKKLVCVGDFRQLPPIAQGSSSKKALSADIFWYLGICDNAQVAHYHPWLVMLDEQRRMHPDISAFSSMTFYKGLLKDHPSVLGARDAIAARPPRAGEALSLVDIGGMFSTAGRNSDNSRFNILSAAVSFAIGRVVEGSSACKVGIIAPYAAQVRLIRAMVQDVRARKTETGISCATVHQFQGSERDVIVMDLVESRPSEKPGILMSSNENGSVDRLVNVGVTRARGKLVAVADRSFWAQCADDRNSFSKLVDYLDDRDCSVGVKGNELRKLLEGLDFGANMMLEFDPLKISERLFMDIGRASHKIIISIPDGELLSPYEGDVCKALKSAKARGVEVLMKCLNWKELPEEWKALGWQSDDATCPLVIVDGKTAWYGAPLSRGKFVGKGGFGKVTVLQCALRITGPHTVEMISSLADLESRVVDGRKQALKDRRGPAQQDSKGKGVDGLALYVKQHEKCPKCKKPMTLSRGWKSGKFFLKCPSCGESALLTKELVNHYICVSQVKCPQCARSLRSGLTARVSRYGLYITCDRGHTVKPDQI